MALGALRPTRRRRGGYLPRSNDETVWLHGASAGEMAAGHALVTLLDARGFRFSPAYTAANRAGVDYIRRADPSNPLATLAPWDTTAALGRAFDRWRPRALFLIETELWPRLVFEAYRREIPVFSVSARIFAADVPRYRAIRAFISRTLRRMTGVLAQDDVERQRFIDLGAPADKCLSVGNLKYALTASPGARDIELAAELGIEPDERVVVFGSFHRDELAMLPDTIHRLLNLGVRVIVAPRHIPAADFMAREASRRRWNFCRRSEGPAQSGWRLLVVDTMGELTRFYSIASCAIAGGGFGRHGGHNPYEPVFAGTPVAFGPHFHNFASEARALASAVPDASLGSISDLDRVLDRWLGDDRVRNRVLELQRSVLPDGAAIARRYAEILGPWLSAPA